MVKEGIAEATAVVAMVAPTVAVAMVAPAAAMAVVGPVATVAVEPATVGPFGATPAGDNAGATGG